MTKSQLINYIAEETEVPRKTAQAMLQALSEVIADPIDRPAPVTTMRR